MYVWTIYRQCLHGTLQRIGVLSGLYSHLMSSVPEKLWIHHNPDHDQVSEFVSQLTCLADMLQANNFSRMYPVSQLQLYNLQLYKTVNICSNHLWRCDLLQQVLILTIPLCTKLEKSASLLFISSNIISTGRPTQIQCYPYAIHYELQSWTCLKFS